MVTKKSSGAAAITTVAALAAPLVNSTAVPITARSLQTTVILAEYQASFWQKVLLHKKRQKQRYVVKAVNHPANSSGLQ